MLMLNIFVQVMCESVSLEPSQSDYLVYISFSYED